MRLLLVTETFPPEVNGVARTLGRWDEAFRARGHTVDVIRPRRPGEPKAFDRVYGIALPFYRQVRIGVASPLRMRRILHRYTPDLVHIATEGPVGLATLLACLWEGVPVASSFHTNFDHYATHYGFLGLEWLAFWYLCWFHNRCAVTLVPSLQTQRRLTEAGVRRVEIWTRGVDGGLFNPRHRDPELRHSLGLEDDDPLLVYVGRLAPEKNLGVLLSAFSRLRQGKPPANRAKLALVGSGPLEEALRASMPQGVVLAGEQTGQALSRWYASGDLFAFPSQSETFGNVVLEAQASGLPVVGFDTQGVNEQVKQGENGFLVPEWGDLKPYLERLCVDVPMRRRMGEAARGRAERLDWKPIFDDLERRYLGLVQEAEQARAALAGGAA